MLRDKVSGRVLAALFPATVEAENITPARFMQKLSEAGIRCSVEWGRLSLEGGPPQERERLRGILHSNPDLEARLILHIAEHDRDVMDSIEERACIRWVEGYSDSLYMAVLCGIPSTREERDYSDAPEEHHPAVWIKRKPKTDWNAERAVLRREHTAPASKKH